MTTGSSLSGAARCVVAPGTRPSARCSRSRAIASRSALVSTLCEKQHTIALRTRSISRIISRCVGRRVGRRVGRCVAIAVGLAGVRCGPLLCTWEVDGIRVDVLLVGESVRVREWDVCVRCRRGGGNECKCG